eukprot:4436331-Prymnesium_polylepis.1
MLEAISQLKNDMKINDWNALEKTFSSLEKMLAKAHQLVAKEGIPVFYFKALIMVEDFVNKTGTDKAVVKKMSQLNAKAFNGMKQKIKKLTVRGDSQTMGHSPRCPSCARAISGRRRRRSCRSRCSAAHEARSLSGPWRRGRGAAMALRVRGGGAAVALAHGARVAAAPRSPSPTGHALLAVPI